MYKVFTFTKKGKLNGQVVNDYIKIYVLFILPLEFIYNYIFQLIFYSYTKYPEIIPIAYRITLLAVNIFFLLNYIFEIDKKQKLQINFKNIIVSALVFFVVYGLILFILIYVGSFIVLVFSLH